MAYVAEAIRSIKKKKKFENLKLEKIKIVKHIKKDLKKYFQYRKYFSKKNSDYLFQNIRYRKIIINSFLKMLLIYFNSTYLYYKNKLSPLVLI